MDERFWKREETRMGRIINDAQIAIGDMRDKMREAFGMAPTQTLADKMERDVFLERSRELGFGEATAELNAVNNYDYQEYARQRVEVSEAVKWINSERPEWQPKPNVAERQDNYSLDEVTKGPPETHDTKLGISYAQYLSDCDAGVDYETAWQRHESRMDHVPEPGVYINQVPAPEETRSNGDQNYQFSEYFRTENGDEIRLTSYGTDDGYFFRVDSPTSGATLSAGGPYPTRDSANDNGSRQLIEVLNERDGMAPPLEDHIPDLAVGGFNVDGEWVDGRSDHEDFWAHDGAEIDRIKRATRDDDQLELGLDGEEELGR